MICFKCGNKIKFVHENGEESVFPAPTPDGIGVIAVQGIGHLVAFSNQSINPSVFVYVYPSFRLISELKGNCVWQHQRKTRLLCIMFSVHITLIFVCVFLHKFLMYKSSNVYEEICFETKYFYIKLQHTYHVNCQFLVVSVILNKWRYTIPVFFGFIYLQIMMLQYTSVYQGVNFF